MKKVSNTINLIAFLILCFFTSSSHGQDKIELARFILEGREMIQRGVNLWNLDTLLGARGIFERVSSVEETDYLGHYYFAYADYRLCVMYFSRKDNDNASIYIEEGIKHLERSIELKPNFAESQALLASLYGFKIGTKWYLGMTLGPKASGCFDKAVEIDSLNPRVFLLLGISKYHTPSLFGGGLDKAKSNLLKSARLYGNSTPADSLLPDWGHEEVYAWLGKICMDEKDYPQAEIQFDNALQVNPECSWVKYELKRQLAEKTKKK